MCFKHPICILYGVSQGKLEKEGAFRVLKKLVIKSDRENVRFVNRVKFWLKGSLLRVISVLVNREL